MSQEGIIKPINFHTRKRYKSPNSFSFGNSEDNLVNSSRDSSVGPRSVENRINYTEGSNGTDIPLKKREPVIGYFNMRKSGQKKPDDKITDILIESKENITNLPISFDDKKRNTKSPMQRRSTELKENKNELNLTDRQHSDRGGGLQLGSSGRIKLKVTPKGSADSFDVNTPKVQEENEKLKHSIKDLQERLKYTEYMFEQAQEQLKQRDIMLRELETIKSDLKETRVKPIIEQSPSTSQHEETQAKISHLEEERNRLRKHIQELQSENVSLHAHLQDNSLQRSQSFELREVAEEHKNDAILYKKKYEDLLTKFEAFEKDKLEIVDERNHLATQLQQIQNQIEEFKEQIIKSDQERDDLQRKLEEVTENNDGREKEWSILGQNFEKVENVLKGEVTRLRDDLTDAEIKAKEEIEQYRIIKDRELKVALEKVRNGHELKIFEMKQGFNREKSRMAADGYKTGVLPREDLGEEGPALTNRVEELENLCQELKTTNRVLEVENRLAIHRISKLQRQSRGNTSFSVTSSTTTCSSSMMDDRNSSTDRSILSESLLPHRKVNLGSVQRFSNGSLPASSRDAHQEKLKVDIKKANKQYMNGRSRSTGKMRKGQFEISTMENGNLEQLSPIYPVTSDTNASSKTSVKNFQFDSDLSRINRSFKTHDTSYSTINYDEPNSYLQERGENPKQYMTLDHADSTEMYTENSDTARRVTRDTEENVDTHAGQTLTSELNQSLRGLSKEQQDDILAVLNRSYMRKSVSSSGIEKRKSANQSFSEYSAPGTHKRRVSLNSGSGPTMRLINKFKEEQSRMYPVKNIFASTEKPRDVDLSITELIGRYAIRNVHLPLIKVSDYNYSLGNKKLNLKLSGGNLLVRQGGGWTLLVELLTKMGY